MVNKPVLVGEIFQWILLFQEFTFEIIVKPGWLNLGSDHLSIIESGEEPTSLEDNLSNAQLFAITMFDDQYKYIIHFMSTGFAQIEFTTTQKKQLVVRATDFQLIVEHLYKLVLDEILRRCVLEHEHPMILSEENAGVAGGHYAGKATVRKILQADLWCSTIHADD